MIVVKPPTSIYPYHQVGDKNGPLVFLSGSIEMGKAIDWQAKVAEGLKDEKVVLLNPRRDDWDSSWKQSLDCEPFVDQVNWELNGLEKSDLIAVHLEPDSVSPVTLLEIGLYARHNKYENKMIIHCPPGYFRKGNIDVLCQRYQIDQADTFNNFIELIRDRIK